MRPSEHDWEEIGADWARRQPHRTWRAHSDAVNGALVDRWVPERARGRALKTDAFDEAFGEGIAPRLAARGYEVWALDVSAATLSAARKRYPWLRTVRADLRDLPFSTGAFHAVISLSTLDHFDRATDIATALRELARVLQPGAPIVATLDNPLNPAVALRNSLPYAWLHRLRLLPYPVGETLPPDRLAEALDRAGFDLEALEAVLHCPRAPAVAWAGIVDRFGSDRARSTSLRALRAFDRVGRWPSRFRTGHFLAARAVRR